MHLGHLKSLFQIHLFNIKPGTQKFLCYKFKFVQDQTIHFF